MELPKVLVAILDFFKFLWASFFTKNESPKPIRLVDLSLSQPFSPEPVRLINLPLSNTPFRLLHLPSLAHDVIFSEWSTEELYHLSKCSRRSRYAVKMFARRQKYYFNIIACKSSCTLIISSHFDDTGSCYHIWRSDSIQPRDEFSCITYSEDFWAATKEEILYLFDVFTRKVNRLTFHDITNITKMVELLKSATPLPVDWVWYNVREIDDMIYKYVLKEFENAKNLEIDASPSADFRFDDMEPFTGEYISIKDADWLTVGNLTRCFTNVKRVRLGFGSRRRLNFLVFNQFLNAWRNGLRVGKLDLKCDYINIDLQCILKNVPTTEVKRVEVGDRKRVSTYEKYFLIRQEESGVKALVYLNVYYSSIHFTTKFRVLGDDEPD